MGDLADLVTVGRKLIRKKEEEEKKLSGVVVA